MSMWNGMSPMKKTLLGFVLCGLMLATILPTSGLAAPWSPKPAQACSSEIGRSTVRGFALYLGPDATGKHVRLFAIRLHYVTVALNGEHYRGVILMKPIEIPTKVIGFHGRVYIYASFFGAFNA